MYSIASQNDEGFFLDLLYWANRILLLSALLIVTTVVICYPLADYFSLNLQLSGHILMIFSATALKIAYVCRLAAQHQLHREVR